jgi:hypothetical protein
MTSERSKSRRLALMAQALMASAVKPRGRDRDHGSHPAASGTPHQRLLTAYLSESRRADRRPPYQELRNNHG